ncbi:MAG: PAS domain S-box protein [Vampirovibrio sp.]|nr:PAS domain S-box protein [Vampirovibrio sp.]
METTPVNPTSLTHLEPANSWLTWLADSSEDGIVSTNVQGLIVYWNKGAERIYGYKAEEVLGKPVTILHPSGIEEEAARIQTSFEKGQPIIEPLETVRLRKDGSQIDVSLRISAVKDDQGNFLGLSGITRNISKLREVEQFFNHSLDLLCIADFNGYFQKVNPAFHTILGFSEEELLSKPFIDFVYPDDQQMTMDCLGSLLDGESVFNFENRYLTKDGRMVWLHWNAYPDFARNIIYAVARDFTAYKALERQKQTFIAALTHDLRTPLQAENQVLTMLHEEDFGPMTDKQQEMVLETKRSNQFMLQMVDNLLTAFRNQDYKLSLHPELTDFNQFIERVIDEEIALLAEEKHLTFELALDSQLPNVKLDPHEIRRVLMNLLHNAIQFSSDKGVIGVNTERAEGSVVCTITDEGPGLDEETMASLFEPYGSHAKKFRHIGTGLGLYVCKQLVEAHQGGIWANNRDDKGSQFSFTLPL